MHLVTRARAVVVIALVATCAASTLGAQGRDDQYDRWDRYRNGRYDAYTRPAVIDAGTLIPVRVAHTISASRPDDRIFNGSIAEDIWDDYGRLAVPLIPRGTPVSMRVRSARGGDLILDLDSIVVGHDRYTIDSSAVRIEGPGDRHGDAAAAVGAGAVIGTIVGAIAGGGKGAAIGAATGAAVGGVSVMAQGREVRVPAGAVVTFRLDHSLAIARSDRPR